MRWFYFLILINFANGETRRRINRRVKGNSNIRPECTSFKIGSITINNDLDEFVRVSVQLWVRIFVDSKKYIHKPFREFSVMQISRILLKDRSYCNKPWSRRTVKKCYLWISREWFFQWRPNNHKTKKYSENSLQSNRRRTCPLFDIWWKQ